MATSLSQTQNQSGFFAVLMVAVTSLVLWSTMSTMNVYSANKSENLAKIKETADMDGIMSDFAVEVQHSFFRHYIENEGVITGNGCPSGYEQCTLSNEGSSTSPKLCHKTGDECKICLTNFHGEVAQTAQEGYCAGVTGFSGQDVFGDCGEDNILCASLAIDANNKSNPPITKAALEDCTQCFVQPIKIYLDIEPSSQSPPISVCTPNPCPTGTQCCNDGTCSATCPCAEGDDCGGSNPCCSSNTCEPATCTLSQADLDNCKKCDDGTQCGNKVLKCTAGQTCDGAGNCVTPPPNTCSIRLAAMDPASGSCKYCPDPDAMVDPINKLGMDGQTCTQRLAADSHKSCKECSDPNTCVDPINKADGTTCGTCGQCSSGVCNDPPAPTCSNCQTPQCVGGSWQCTGGCAALCSRCENNVCESIDGCCMNDDDCGECRSCRQDPDGRGGNCEPSSPGTACRTCGICDISGTCNEPATCPCSAGEIQCGSNCCSDPTPCCSGGTCSAATCTLSEADVKDCKKCDDGTQCGNKVSKCTPSERYDGNGNCVLSPDPCPVRLARMGPPPPPCKWCPDPDANVDPVDRPEGYGCGTCGQCSSGVCNDPPTCPDTCPVRLAAMDPASQSCKHCPDPDANENPIQKPGDDGKTCTQRLYADSHRSCKECSDPNFCVDPTKKTDETKCAGGQWTCCDGKCLPQPSCPNCWRIGTCRVWNPNLCDGVTPNTCKEGLGEQGCGGPCNRAANDDANVNAILQIFPCSTSPYCFGASDASEYTPRDRLELCCID